VRGWLAALCVLAAISLSLPRAAGAAYTIHADIPYLPGGTPQNQLDVYEPAEPSDGRTVVLYVHGGQWKGGDKTSRIDDKARAFTDEGYVFVSTNYRLSPNPPDSSNPDRIKFPDHPDDVGSAIGWVHQNASSYGADPQRIVLIGQSAGAHLVSLVGADPSAYGVARRWLRGVVSLDVRGLDISAYTENERLADLFYNAFATPAENHVGNQWAAASPITHANRGDPPFLFIVGSGGDHFQENSRMADALGQDPSSVVAVDRDHGEINQALGAPDDTSGITETVLGFVAVPLHTSIDSGPAEGSSTNDPTPTFRFSSIPAGSTFECRFDGDSFQPCSSPHTTANLADGPHTLQVRAIDEAANTDPTPATRSFTVDTTQPTPLLPLPMGLPSNQFGFGKLKLNEKRGTAKLLVKVPGPGELQLAKTKCVKADEETAEAAGTEKIAIKAKGKARKKLNHRGRAEVKAKITFIPDGGEPSTQTAALKLIKRG
jgi:arylformamidase